MPRKTPPRDLPVRAAKLRGDFDALFRRAYAKESGVLSHVLPAEVAHALQELDELLTDAGLVKASSGVPINQQLIELAATIDAAADLYRNGEKREAMWKLAQAIEAGPWWPVVRFPPSRDDERFLHDWLTRHWPGVGTKRAPTGKLSTLAIVRELAKPKRGKLANGEPAPKAEVLPTLVSKGKKLHADRLNRGDPSD